MSFPDDSLVETLHANAGASEDVGSIPGSRRILEKEMAALFSILAWKIPGTKDPGGLQSMGSERVRHDWAYSHMCAIMLLSFHHVLGFLVWFILLVISLLFLFFFFFLVHEISVLFFPSEWNPNLLLKNLFLYYFETKKMYVSASGHRVGCVHFL